MICAACHAENIPGDAFCSECGHDLYDLDVSQPGSAEEASLMNDPLESLGPARAVTVAPDASVAECIQTMADHKCRCLLVIEGEEVTGILTERDILMKVAGLDVDPKSARASDIMTRRPEMLKSGHTVAYALNKMAIGGFRHVPLRAQDGSVCVLTVKDLLGYLVRTVDSQQGA